MNDLNEQVIELIRDQFRVLNEKVDGIHEVVKSHVDEDRRYWTKIDEQQAQLSLLKWLFGGGGLTAALAWLHDKLGGHH